LQYNVAMANSTEIYLADNHLMIKTAYGDPAMHSHRAAHLIISTTNQLEVVTDNSTIAAAGVLIPSGVSHTVKSLGSPLLVFMFDDTTTAAAAIKELQILDTKTATQITELYKSVDKENPDNTTEKLNKYEQFFTKVSELTNLGMTGCRVTDERIIDTMKFVDDNIKDGITESQAAGRLFLSDSRFSHLFKSQTGISFAGYVILRRMYKTYILLSQGMSITDASVEAGFSSPSHFAGLNKKLFGINAGSLSEGLKVYTR